MQPGQPRPAKAAKATVKPATKTVLVAQHPAVAVTQVEVQAPASAVAREPPGLLVAHYATLCIPVLLAVLFVAGHDAMDRPNPDAGAARTMYTVVLVAGVVGLAGSAYLATRSHPVAMLGVAAGIPIALWVASLARVYGGYYCDNMNRWSWSTTYPCNRDALIGGDVTLLATLPLIGAGVAAAFLHRANAKAAMALFVGTTMALGAAFALAAALVLPQVGGDVAKASAANQVVHHTPGVELAVLAAALLGLAAIGRLRRRR
ncbi:MAG: hypothetical protein QOD77_1727 [Thermoplasmata archaeon]|jgi:hypothetical protein|nr:hypothetical protein [Thermoplasmata archaeon]